MFVFQEGDLGFVLLLRVCELRQTQSPIVHLFLVEIGAVIFPLGFLLLKSHIC